ncbi:probable UDP-3-O-acyl-N-acetylglucosamine deacetylase 1, mitochondrial isoform X2 [Andrographis paniculata]|uniref:probable UDP-3-O-acyl-N-acetylglucosamine deacetylase 1, mitochondrial isoform X2 n=1 Tax=Andrographis paniculata TaxID=175694 RepID=UPI0021E80136|nr:probable UDP-3-O-acyl-N-acetylglucosamine deacetylase 1, mitochondrial isoform X2 [Andrographis paniculata]
MDAVFERLNTYSPLWRAPVLITVTSRLTGTTRVIALPRMCLLQWRGEGGEVKIMKRVPIFDGSAREWVEAIKQAGLKVAGDDKGESCDKLAPYLTEPVRVVRNDSFVAAFPCSKVNISYGIDYPQVPTIGRQWFSSSFSDDSFYSEQIASSRTFCIYEEVEEMRKLGLIKGGSAETAMICSKSRGWLNPPLRYNDEPCRHKVLDLIGDVSLLAQGGNQGLPVAHIVAYKAGHSLNTELVRHLSGIN